jgi:hypothetical protein
MTTAIALVGILPLLSPAAVLGVPAGEPNRGQNPADFPAPVWVEHGSRQVWLEAARVGYTPAPCPPAPSNPPPADWCGGNAPPTGLPLAAQLVPTRDIRAALTVRVGDVIRFHLPAPSATRPLLRVGQGFRFQKRVAPGRAYGLGTTDAPWWRVTTRARSRMSTLTTSTGTYWFKLAVRRS